MQIENLGMQQYLRFIISIIGTSTIIRLRYVYLRIRAATNYKKI